MKYATTLAILLCLLSCSDRPKTNPDGTPMTERQILVDDQFSGWDGSHPALTTLIKRGMNDPDSYEHVETMFRDDGDDITVKVKYRGRNALGGTVTENVTARVDTKGNVVEIIDQ